MVRPELRLRGRSASEEGEESLCDTVLCCILLSMRCVRLRCVWFCVFLLDLDSQALVCACVSSCVPPNGGELSKCLLCDKLMWLSRSWGWLVHCLSVYHLPAWEMGPWLWPWPDYIIMFVLCVKSWLYCNVTAMWCAHQARVGVSYICNVHVMYSAGYFAQQFLIWYSPSQNYWVEQQYFESSRFANICGLHPADGRTTGQLFWLYWRHSTTNRQTGIKPTGVVQWPQKGTQPKIPGSCHPKWPNRQPVVPSSLAPPSLVFLDRKSVV